MDTKRRSTEWLQGRAGFTLIEIMVVIVILGLLAALVVPKLVGRTEEAKKIWKTSSGRRPLARPTPASTNENSPTWAKASPVSQAIREP